MKLPAHIQATFYALMEAWLAGRLSSDGDSCKHLQDKIYYLRVRNGNNQYRLYFSVNGTAAVALHACYKNQQKLDQVTAKLVKERAKTGSSKPSD